MHNIVIIEDETAIRQLLETLLTHQGYTVRSFSTAKPALTGMKNNPPDLLLLDLGLPDQDGQVVIQTIRSQSELPIIVLSARSHENEKITALENGADDYVTKPFGHGELLARIRTALRHATRVNSKFVEIYEYENLRVDLNARRVWLNSEDIRLTPTEYKLLAALVQQAGKVVIQSKLIRAVWGLDNQGNSHYLRIYIQHLRNKLGDDPLNPRFIFTEAGIGYRMIG